MVLYLGGGALSESVTDLARFTPADGLPHPVVNAVFQDREHQFWFATWGGGVALYDAHSISIFDLSAAVCENSPKDEQRNLADVCRIDRGDIWIGYFPLFS